MNKREERYGHFIASLEGWRLYGVGPGRLGAYTDGGPSIANSDHIRRKARKAARKRNR